MKEGHIVIDQAELETNLRIYLALLNQRRPAVLRDLWTRRGEEYDRARIEHARSEFASFVAERICRSYQLSRPANAMDEIAALNRAAEAGG